MPKDLGEGLYLTAVGMGVVFFCLAALMLVLLVLRKLFPGEEVAESVETQEAPAVVGTEVAQQASKGLASVEVQEPLAALQGSTEGRTVGVEVAVMAVAKYLATEQQEQVGQAPAVDRATTPSQEGSDWKTQGRDLSRGNQGRRPPPYGEKTQSAYPLKDSVKE